MDNNTTIVSGHGCVDCMNDLAVQASEKTKKDFNKEEKSGGYKAPEYVKQNVARKDGSSEGEKTVAKIVNGQAYVQDFETFVNNKINQTKKDNNEKHL